MKKLLTIIVLMALAMGGFAQILHYDFSAVCETGQTLYYRISNEEEKTVMLTYPFSEENSWFTGDNYYDGHPEPQGEITLPLTVTYNDIQYFITAIDDNAFNYCCGLTGNLTIPEGIVSIGSRAFRHCNFTSITLPKSLEVIVSLDYGYGTPFVYCSSLESISVDDENPIFYSENNAIIRREDKTLVVGCKTTTIPDEIETIGHSAFQGAGDGGDLVIPNSVTAINDYAFYESQFSGTITFSDSLRYIGVKAFSYCHISGSLSIPSSVTEIGNYAFSDCSHLTGNLSLSSSLSTINKRAFQHVGCNGTLIIPNSVNHIGEGAFYFTNFSELVLGNSVTTIEDNAFNNIWNSIHLTGALKLPTSLIEIGREAFAYTAFDEIHSPNTTPPTLNTLAFQQCDNNIPIHIPFGCTEAYQNAEGWNYFTNFIEEEPILYTDYEPDTCKFITSSHESDFLFDIDYDGVVDMTLFGYTQHGAVLVTIDMSSGYEICPSNENTVLNSDTINWRQSYDLSNGFPLDSYRKRFGFRKMVNEQYYYGWMEIYWDGIFYSEGKMIYVDRIAFCTIPDYLLRWGQTEIETPSPTPIVPDLYTIGYKDNNSATRTAKLYKNNALLHSIRVTGKQVTPYKIANDSEGNIYWMVVYSANSSTLQTEIWKNDELYLSTEGQNGVTIKDLYCLGDTLFYVGNMTTEEGTKVATVWRGPDFTPHWVLGDGLYDSFIYDADVDKNTHIPYFCGYITDSLNKASVWKASQLFYKQEPSGVQRASWTKEISVDNGSIFTNGYLNYDNGFEIISMPTIWKDNDRISNFSPLEFINCLYAYQDDYYFTFNYPHGMYYGVLKNGHELLQLSLNQSIQRIYGGFDDIYMVGKSDNKGSIWKNFELLSQLDGCDVIMDILAVEATNVNTTFDEPTNNGYAVYPNPTNGILFVESLHAMSLPAKTEYRITNLMGQTLLQGHITAEKQQINIDNLPAGLYFITFAGETRKFVVE